MTTRDWMALEQMAAKRRSRVNMAGELAIPEFEPAQGQARTGDVGWFEDEIRDRGEETRRASSASRGAGGSGMGDAFGAKTGRWDIPNFRERMKVPPLSFDNRDNKREMMLAVGGGAAVLGLTGLMAYMGYRQDKEDIELQERYFKAQEKAGGPSGMIDDRADMKLDADTAIIGIGAAALLVSGVAWYMDNKLRQEEHRIMEEEIGRMEGRADMAGGGDDQARMFQVLSDLFDEDPSIFPMHHDEELDSVGRTVALQAMEQKAQRGEDLGTGQKVIYPYQNPMGELRWLMPEYMVNYPERSDMQFDSHAAQSLGLAGGNPMEYIQDRDRKHLRADMVDSAFPDDLADLPDRPGHTNWFKVQRDDPVRWEAELERLRGEAERSGVNRRYADETARRLKELDVEHRLAAENLQDIRRGTDRKLIRDSLLLVGGLGVLGGAYWWKNRGGDPDPDMDRTDMADEAVEFAGIAEAVATGIVAMAADAKESGALSEEDIVDVADLVDMVLEVSVAVESGQDPGEAGSVVAEFLESNMEIADVAGEIGAALLATEGE